MSNLEPLGNGFLGSVLSSLYGGALFLREIRFKLLKPKKFPFPIISVGGISAGGTGKTPLTSTIIDMVVAQGATPILFSRGYGRESTTHRIITPQEEVSWKEVGDEPAMLKARHPQLWLAIGPKRVKNAQSIAQNLPQNAIGIMDDGFQHRYLHRDLDIVTLPPSLFQDHLIPAGLLREPLSALKRAHLLIPISASPLPEEYLSHLKSSQKTIIEGRTETPYWQHCTSGKQLEKLRGDTALFSGIARPQRFITAAQQRSETIVSSTIFDDHHPFSSKDIAQLNSIKCDQFGTTEKDLQRLLPPDADNDAYLSELYYLVVKVELTDRAHLQSLIASLLRGYYD